MQLLTQGSGVWLGPQVRTNWTATALLPGALRNCVRSSRPLGLQQPCTLQQRPLAVLLRASCGLLAARCASLSAWQPAAWERPSLLTSRQLVLHAHGLQSTAAARTAPAAELPGQGFQQSAEQRAAAMADIDKPLAVVAGMASSGKLLALVSSAWKAAWCAGAGSGKTSMLVGRVKHLLDCGVRLLAGQTSGTGSVPQKRKLDECRLTHRQL